MESCWKVMETVGFCKKKKVAAGAMDDLVVVRDWAGTPVCQR